jgi:hypothetical protein
MDLPDNIKVSLATFLGVATPGANLFLDGVEPLLKVLLLAAQIAVAVCSALYVYSKWKKNR